MVSGFSVISLVAARVGSAPYHTARHPFSALFTAAMISLMVIAPSPFASPAAHAETGLLPRAMLTMVISSLTVT